MISILNNNNNNNNNNNKSIKKGMSIGTQTASRLPRFEPWERFL